MIANVREKADKILRKLTRRGLPNPRIRNAQRQEIEAKLLRKDLVGEFKVWKRAEIAATYTEDYVANLLHRANTNLKNMTAPKVKPFWVEED